MKRTKQFIAALALSSLSAASLAGGYVGVNYAHMDVDLGDHSVDLGAVVFKAGYQFNEWVALEARAGVGVRDDDFNHFGEKVDVKLDNLFGGYLIAGIPTATIVYPYAVVGYTRARFEASVPGFTTADSEEDFSYGVGANFAVTEQVMVNLEAIRYLEDAQADTIGLGVTYRF